MPGRRTPDRVRYLSRDDGAISSSARWLTSADGFVAIIDWPARAAPEPSQAVAAAPRGGPLRRLRALSFPWLYVRLDRARPRDDGGYPRKAGLLPGQFHGTMAEMRERYRGLILARLVLRA
jgi:hypothetical protein